MKRFNKLLQNNLLICFVISTACFYSTGAMAQTFSLDWYFGVNPSALKVQVTDIETDQNNNVYVCGNFYGTADLDPSAGTAIITNTTNLSNNQNNGDVFLASYDANGAFRWVKTYGGPGNEGSTSIAVNSSGYVCWLFSTGEYIFLEPSIPQSELTFFSGGGVAVWITPNGDFLSFASYNEVGLEAKENVKFDSSSNTIMVAGANNGSSDQKLRKYTASLQLDWSRIIKIGCLDITTDNAGNIYLMAKVYGSGYFFQDTNEAYYNVDILQGDILIVKVSSTGAYLWSGTIGGTQYESGLELECDGSGKLFVAFGALGNYEVDILGSGQVYTNFYQNDGVLCAYNLSGQLLWIDRFGDDVNTFSNTIPSDLKYDAYNNVIYINQDLGTDVDGDPGTGVVTNASGIWGYSADTGVLTYTGSGFLEEEGEIAISSIGNIYFTDNIGGSTTPDVQPGNATTLIQNNTPWIGFYVASYHISNCSPTYAQVSLTACNGSSVVYNGNTYFIGENTVTLTNQLGCDSIVTLIVSPAGTPTQISRNITSCTSFFYQGQLISSPGTYQFQWPAQGSCIDSLVTLNVSEPAPQEIYHGVYVCNPFVYQNQTINANGDYYFDWVNANGCTDSTVHWNVQFMSFPAYPLVTPSGNNYIIYSDLIQFSASYIFRNCDNNQIVQSGASASFTTAIPGNYAIEYVPNSIFNIAQNCDFTTNCIYVGPTIVSEEKIKSYQLYPNPSSSHETITVEGLGNESHLIQVRTSDGRLLKEYKSGLEQSNIQIENLSSGVYLLEIRTGEQLTTLRFVVL